MTISPTYGSGAGNGKYHTVRKELGDTTALESLLGPSYFPIPEVQSDYHISKNFPLLFQQQLSAKEIISAWNDLSAKMTAAFHTPESIRTVKGAIASDLFSDLRWKQKPPEPITTATLSTLAVDVDQVSHASF
jgi:hypothetical protein